MSTPLPIESANFLSDQFASKYQALKSKLATLESDGLSWLDFIPLLLISVDWNGSERELLEALPYNKGNSDFNELKNAMARLGYSLDKVSLDEKQHYRVLPWLFVDQANIENSSIILDASSSGVVAYNIFSNEAHAMPFADLGKQVYCLKKIKDKDAGHSQSLAGYFKPIKMSAIYIVTLTLFSNIFALLMPLFVMNVYDKAIDTRSISTLVYLVVGISIVLSLDFVLKRIRVNIVSYAAHRFSYSLGLKALEKMLSWPYFVAERMNVNSQLQRVNEADRIKSFFSGPGFFALLDLPFVFLFLLVIYMLGGYMVFIPIIVIIIYLLLYPFAYRKIQSNTIETSRASNKKQEYILEAVEKMSALRAVNEEQFSLRRFNKLSQDAAAAIFRSNIINNHLNSIAHTLNMLGGVAMLALGVQLVLAGSLTTGGLIASVMLVWRCLSPVQTTFLSLGKIRQLQTGVQGVSRLLDMEAEVDSERRYTPIQKLNGKVSFDKVTFRYDRSYDPVITNISFDILPGEVVAIVGRNGSGKSTILKLIASIYSTQIGSISLDNCDSRQFNPMLLRQKIAYFPQQPQLLIGSLRENLLLANPLADEHAISDAIKLAGLQAEIERLPEKLDTYIDYRLPQQWPLSFVTRFALAQIYLKNASIILLDEPVNGLDYESEFLFMEALQKIRGSASVFCVTHRPGHLGIADKVLLLDKGNQRFFGPAADVIGKIPFEMM